MFSLGQSEITDSEGSLKCHLVMAGVTWVTATVLSLASQGNDWEADIPTPGGGAGVVLRCENGAHGGHLPR